MTLASVLAEQFRGDIRFRGAALFKKGDLSVSRITADGLTVVVKDPVDQFTRLEREGDTRIKLSCTCGGDSQTTSCKHLWATILLADSGGLISAPPRPGHFPPFVVAPAPSFDIDDEPFEMDSRRDVYTPPKIRPGREAVVAPPLRPWEAKLRSVSTVVHSQTDAKQPAARQREIFYEIDVGQSRDKKQIVLQTSQRQRRSNGHWGKRKPLKLRSNQLNLVDRPDDRRILSYLMGGLPERPTWFSNGPDTSQSIYRYYLTFDLSDVLIPLMSSTGRLHVLTDDVQPGAPLEWDETAPWELALDVEDDQSQNEYLMGVRVHRGDESHQLRHVTLVVPGGYIIVNNKIARLEDFDAFDFVTMLGNGTANLPVPKEDGHEFVDKLLDMPQLPRLELPPELKLEEFRCPPVPQVTLHMPRGVRWQQERLRAEVGFDYAGTKVRMTSPQAAIVQREYERCIPRDRPQEEEFVAQLEPLGFRKLPRLPRSPYDVELPAKTLGAAVRGLIKLGWRVNADGGQVHEPGTLKFDIKSGIDWFELRGQVDFGGRTIPFPELLAALGRGECTVRLDDGSLGIIPEEWFARFGLLPGLGEAQDDHVRFASTQLGLLDALLLAKEDVQFDARFEELRQRVRDFRGISSTVEPEGFMGTLRQYQREGFGWLTFLQDFRFGGCLADDMGLGKTVQLLALLQARKNSGIGTLPSLVVVPKSLIFNWKQESEKFTPNLKVVEYVGIQRGRMRRKLAKSDLILTTYGTIRRDILQLKDQMFDYIVLDEAQAIKNAGSQVAKSVRLLKAQQRLALSGTPIENRLSDLWSIFEFLNPGMLGRASAFRAKTDPNNPESRQLLSQALRPFILRRTKKEVAQDLPDKLEQTISCTMPKSQQALYDELREHYRSTLLGAVKREGMGRSKIHVLEALLRLRQAACHPGLLNPEKISEPSAKIDVLLIQLQDLLAEGHKALVFSQFTSFLAIVKKALDEKGIAYEYLDGQTRDRKKPVEHFQNDPACGVFLISLKAGGLGLNLTAADYVFLLDPWWNPAVEMQAIDRAHRLGQKRQVFAYRLICRNSVEEKIAELQTKKKNLADAILQADNNLLSELTAEDLEILLS